MIAPRTLSKTIRKTHMILSSVWLWIASKSIRSQNIKKNSPPIYMTTGKAQNHLGIWSQGISSPLRVHTAANAGWTIENASASTVDNFANVFIDKKLVISIMLNSFVAWREVMYLVDKSLIPWHPFTFHFSLPCRLSSVAEQLTCNE